MAPEAEFEAELENFRREVEGGAQFLYAFLAIHAVAGDRPEVHALLNRAPLFWNTNLAALQSGIFITLGRIFDQRSPHNIDTVLRLAERNRGIFSKSALGSRKQGTSAHRPAWLDQYLVDAHEATRDDFRRLRGHVKKRRLLYERNYRDLRHKVFAHRELADPAAVTALFSKTNIRELERLFTFLSSLHEALWQLLFNGRKPVLRPLRYSVKRMRDLPSPSQHGNGVHERIVQETERFLSSAACGA
jgi:hypothetical protein